jgi:hypothetical protein
MTARGVEMRFATFIVAWGWLIGASPAQQVEIPLDKIWGYNMPTTRDISGIHFP